MDHRVECGLTSISLSHHSADQASFVGFFSCSSDEILKLSLLPPNPTSIFPLRRLRLFTKQSNINNIQLVLGFIIIFNWHTQTYALSLFISLFPIPVLYITPNTRSTLFTLNTLAQTHTVKTTRRQLLIPEPTSPRPRLPCTATNRGHRRNRSRLSQSLSLILHPSTSDTMATTMVPNHYAAQQVASYSYVQPQPPPSPPMDDNKCSLPSISNLLGLADAGSPTSETSPQNQQQQASQQQSPRQTQQQVAQQQMQQQVQQQQAVQQQMQMQAHQQIPQGKEFTRRRLTRPDWNNPLTNLPQSPLRLPRGLTLGPTLLTIPTPL